jgi:hypothetical protein
MQNMPYSSFSDKQFDYLEVVLMHPDRPNSYDIPEEQFIDLINKFKKRQKGFQQFTKEYVYNDMHLIKKIENNDVVESKVYKQKAIEIQNVENGKFRMVFYEKKKLPVIAFQSTSNIHNTVYKRKLIFRVTNKLFINFQLEMHDTELSRKIYINFNNSKDADHKDIEQKITHFMDILASTC